jgi:protein-tyrosine phosphatase
MNRLGAVATVLLSLWVASCGSQQAAEKSAGGMAGAAADAATEAGSSGTGGGSGQGGQAGNGGEGGVALQDAGPPGGPVELSGVYNARDTGGLSTTSGKPLRRKVLIRSGHLAELDASGCQQLSALGIRSVVDLRAATAANSQPDVTCVTSTTVYYLADLPKILPPSEQSYAQTLDAAEPKLAAIYGQLSAPDGLPAIVHCVIGRDRASLITAVLLLSLGVPRDQVVIDFASNQDASVSVDASWLQPLFERVDAAGGIEAYLQSHGVTQAQLDQLRAQALEE